MGENLDKRAEFDVEIRAIEEFVEWLIEHEYHIGKYLDDEYQRCNFRGLPRHQLSNLINESFGIDSEELERERRELLEQARSSSESEEGGLIGCPQCQAKTTIRDGDESVACSGCGVLLFRE